ncbi:AfsR/SARP family transcriptional regulator, partial [Micromonospora tarensis]
MRWSLLGPVQVTAGGRVLPIDRPQQRAVLALLLLNADRLVPLGQLVAALWANDPPASARTQVQVCVSRIRAALREAGATDVLTTQGGGYRLTVRGASWTSPSSPRRSSGPAPRRPPAGGPRRRDCCATAW